MIPYKQNSWDRKQITGHQGGQVGGGLTAKGQEGSIWDNGTVYLDCSGSYKIVGICQNSYIEMYTKKGEFYLMQLSLQSKKKKK